MVDKKIQELREKLNNLIEEKADFSQIQEVSTELDKCLIEYMNKNTEKTSY